MSNAAKAEKVRELGPACPLARLQAHDPDDPESRFRYVKGYAKFGGAKDGGAHFTAPKNASWSPRDWAALVSRLDRTVERALGYAYDAGRPGIYAAYPALPGSGVLRPEPGSAGGGGAKPYLPVPLFGASAGRSSPRGPARRRTGTHRRRSSC